MQPTLCTHIHKSWIHIYVIQSNPWLILTRPADDVLCRWCIHRQHCHIVIYHPQWFTSSHRPTPTPLDLSSVLRQGNARNSALSRMLNPPHVQLSSPLSLHVRLPRSRPSIAIFNLINSSVSSKKKDEILTQRTPTTCPCSSLPNTRPTHQPNHSD